MVMYRRGITLLALSGLLASTSEALAQVDIKVPFVRVSTGGPGGGVYVRAPFVTVDFGSRLPMAAREPLVMP